MPLILVRNDITKMKCDAIVNAAKNSLLGGGGVDGAIHKAAGKQLLEECKTLGGCETGKAKVTGAYKLPCKYVIHTVGPVWYGGDKGEKELLESAYRSSLEAAVKYECKTVAFPVISAGVYGYPKKEAIKIATDTISDYLEKFDLTVYLVIFDKDIFSYSKEKFRDIEEYIDDNYVDEHFDGRYLRMCSEEPDSIMKSCRNEPVFDICADACYESVCLSSLDEDLKNLDESFLQLLLRMIDERGLTDAQCYKKANIDRKLFSKIRNNEAYKPSKQTVLSFAIALELSLSETEELLKRAGYALSHSYKSDVIIEYYIKHKNYDIFEINETLFNFDQPLLA